eukprot:74507-Pleurochrysis_carterae.AAC.1
MSAVPGANKRAGNIRVHQSPRVGWCVQLARVRQPGCVGLAARVATIKSTGGERRWSVGSEFRELT